jgi:hypothetical protein
VTVEELELQRPEEALDDGVEAVAYGAHRAEQASARWRIMTLLGTADKWRGTADAQQFESTVGVD